MPLSFSHNWPMLRFYCLVCEIKCLGRIIFMLNYFGHPLAGTTDVMDDKTHYCEPTQEEIDLTKRYYGINEEIKQSKIIK